MILKATSEDQINVSDGTVGAMLPWHVLGPQMVASGKT